MAPGPITDYAARQRLTEGRSLACFQVESPGMRHLLQQTGAHDMHAVIQALAMIRLGPASSGMKDTYARRFQAGCKPEGIAHEERPRARRSR